MKRTKVTNENGDVTNLNFNIMKLKIWHIDAKNVSRGQYKVTVELSDHQIFSAVTIDMELIDNAFHYEEEPDRTNARKSLVEIVLLKNEVEFEQFDML